MCELSIRLGIHRHWTKFIDVKKANLTYRKQRKHSRSQTRKITRSLHALLGKILKEIREIVRGKEVKSVEFGGHLTLKLAVNAELLLVNCILAMKDGQKIRPKRPETDIKLKF